FDRSAADSLVKLDHLRNPPKVGDEVQHDDLLLTGADTKPTSKLLHEDASAVCRAHERDQVHVRYINALVEQVHCGHDVELTGAEAGKQPITLAGVHLGRN